MKNGAHSYRIIIIGLSISFFILCNTSCKLYEIISAQEKVGEYLPDTFRVELLLHIDDKGYFCIPVTINDQNDMDFIIDTQAICLGKEDEFAALGAKYQGLFPLYSKNAFGQKQKYSLYSFDSFKIHSLSFNTPFLKAVNKDNYLYSIMHKNILGVNVLKHLFWKFSIDEKKSILFSNKDADMIEKETDGFIKIERGLSSKINLTLGDDGKKGDFLFDLGFHGEIEIDKKIFHHYSNTIPYRKILIARTEQINDTVYLFENLKVKFENFVIDDCQFIYREKVNKNLIGTRLMHRFNFILAYTDNFKNLSSQYDLYIKPVREFNEIRATPYISQSGIHADCLEGAFIVSRIELGSDADMAGLQLWDRILSINDESMDLYSKEEVFSFIDTKERMKLTIERKNKNINLFIGDF
ncbi:MAG: PDZ domain-containing protein [Tannerellaceae bacterium]|jgi:hypothetical protein|nr:PDZ domain-containing protein [Tannerellaceae bacterium]